MQQVATSPPIYTKSTKLHCHTWLLDNDRLYGSNVQSCLKQYTQPNDHNHNFQNFKVHFFVWFHFHSSPPQEWQTSINTNTLWQIALIPLWSISILTGTVSSVQRLKYPIRRACVTDWFNEHKNNDITWWKPYAKATFFNEDGMFNHHQQNQGRKKKIAASFIYFPIFRRSIKVRLN